MEAEKSAFVRAFGDAPHVRVLDFFLTFPAYDYAKKQVADETGVARLTVEKIWKHLVEEGFIVKTRRIGRAEMYRLNAANPRVKAVLEMDFKLSQAFAEEQKPLAQAIKSRHVAAAR